MAKLIYEYNLSNGLKKTQNLSNSSRLIIKEAEKMGINWKIIRGTKIIALDYKNNKKYFYNQIPSPTSALGIYACNNKKVTTNLLRLANINVPNGYRIKKDYGQDYLLQVFYSLKKPLVVKPSDGTWGENISLNITDEKGYLDAIDLAFSYTSRKNSGAVVEEMFNGEEYRILLTKKKVIGVLKRVPANVIGNGVDSIKKLIKEKNKEDIRGVKGSDKSHLKIRMDKRMKKLLLSKNLTFESVPKKDEQVFLRKVSNISQGGDAIDYTDKVHKSVREIALKAINAIPGLFFVGIDFMTKDITVRQDENSYVIIEINNSPGFDIHDQPYKGKNRHAAREFIYLLFPELKKVN